MRDRRIRRVATCLVMRNRATQVINTKSVKKVITTVLTSVEYKRYEQKH